VALPTPTRIVSTMPRILALIALAIALLIVRNWAYVTTYRLYLSQRADSAAHSAAAQRFDIEGARVVPQIVSRDDDLIAFKTDVGRPSTLRVGIRPTGRANYEIRWRDGSTAELLARGETTAPITVSYAIPARAGRVEFVSHGSIAWIDPRLVRDLLVLPHLAAIALLLIMSFALSRFDGTRGSRMTAVTPRESGDRTVLFRRLALAGGVAMTLVTAEAGMRALGDRIPSGIASERHDLGEVRQDPRWEDTERYGRRLRARVDAINEWRHGDIVAPGMPVGFHDAAGIGLHRGALQRAARLGFDDGREILVL